MDLDRLTKFFLSLSFSFVKSFFMLFFVALGGMLLMFIRLEYPHIYFKFDEILLVGGIVLKFALYSLMITIFIFLFSTITKLRRKK